MIFDFEEKLHDLYRLFPNQGILDARVARMSRMAFINTTINGEWLLRIRHFMDKLDRKRQDQKAEKKRMQDLMITERFFSLQQHRKRW